MPAAAQVGKGPQTIQNGTFSKHPEVNSTTYTIAAGTDLGNWTSDLAYSNTDALPTIDGQIAIQIGTSSTTTLSQLAFPGDVPNNVPASSTWLYMRGNNANTSTQSFWEQNVTVRPGATYTFFCYASNALNAGSTTTNAPILQFMVNGVQVGATSAIPAETTGGDKWTRYAVSYTAPANTTAVSLALRNIQTVGTTGNELAVTSISFRADNPGTVNMPYNCDGRFYQIRQVIPSTGLRTNSTRLYSVNRAATGTGYSTTELRDLGASLNALGYNPGTALNFALTYISNEVGSNTAGGDRVNEYNDPIELYRIDINGDIVSQGMVANLPVKQWAGGAVDRAGNYYVVSQELDAPQLWRINVSGNPPYSATRMALMNAPAAGNGFAMYDLAFNPKDGNLYGAGFLNTAYKLVINNTNNTATVTSLNPSFTNVTQVNNDYALGSLLFDLTGTLYGYRNGGQFYIIDTTTGQATSLSTVDRAANSDGGSCVTPDQSLDVVKQVTAIAATSTLNQYTVDFRLQISNNGTVTDPNVQVSDLLWGGNTTANANTTFSGASSVVVSNLRVTNVGAASLAPNNSFSGLSGQAGLLTGNQSLAAGQRATIEFRATVTFPGAQTAVQNNTAFATTTVSPSTGYYLVGSVLVPPAELYAQDASTNSATLPTTRNADVPSPSPIAYPPAIAGNVFEDVNYGGGLGRSLLGSGGVGVNSVRVELYKASDRSFITAVNTDANGFYLFDDKVIDLNTNYLVRVVNNSVRSTRPGSTNSLLPVQTFRTDATGASGPVSLTDRVGGEQPNEADYDRFTRGTLPVSGASATEEVQSVTQVNIGPSGPGLGVDFGFNFDLVVNTNNAGQGSLRSFIDNANALTNAGLSQAGRTAGREYALFMMNDGRAAGTAPAGLRLGMTAPTGYNFTTKEYTITLSTALPTITASNTAIDGSLQTAVTGDNVAASAEVTTGPEVVINFNSAAGLLITGGATRIENVGLNSARGTSTATPNGVAAEGAGVTFSGAATTGSVLNMVTTASNTTAGVRLQSGATGVTVSNSVLNNSVAAGNTNGEGLVLSGASLNTISNNTISNNSGFGLLMESGQTNNENTITANILRGNGGGSNAENAGVAIGSGNNNLISLNTFSTNAGSAVVAAAGTSGNRITQNSMTNNTDLGIDLMATGATGLNGDGITRNDDTDVDTGANGLLNFPVISQAVTNGGNLIITGYAPAGALVELFVADVQADGFGEGRTYLTSWTEGSAQDGDSRIGGYSGLVSGVDQGNEKRTSLFMFSIPVSSLSPAQQAALTASGARLTVTATLLTTVNGLAVGNTSEFSGNIALLQNRPLPVELVHFSAVAHNTTAQLSWTTASEKNNARFVVERSLTGEKFEAIGTVNGQGNSVEKHSYQFVDQRAAASKVVYYRLRQEDADGTYSFSNVQVVRFDNLSTAASPVTVYPNPTTADASLDLRGLPAGTYQISVIDLTGRVLLNTVTGTDQKNFLATAHLPQGGYIVTILGMGQRRNLMLVKK
ncbi:NosD domain-containing protein [Hymenobacter sp.]|uniref:NosD domain-containing protein n=1 Tax=Hymenobacter sp. TaxID=1898978 RepID=UPI002EDA013D